MSVLSTFWGALLSDFQSITFPGFPPPFPLVGVGTRLFLCFVISLLFDTIYCSRKCIIQYLNSLEINCTTGFWPFIWKKCRLFSTNYLPARVAIGSNAKQVKTKDVQIRYVQNFFSFITFSFTSIFFLPLAFEPGVLKNV